MIARIDADATRVRFSIRSSIGGREIALIPIVATFQTDDEGDFFAILVDDSRLTDNRD